MAFGKMRNRSLLLSVAGRTISEKTQKRPWQCIGDLSHAGVHMHGSGSPKTAREKYEDEGSFIRGVRGHWKPEKYFILLKAYQDLL